MRRYVCICQHVCDLRGGSHVGMSCYGGAYGVCTFGYVCGYVCLRQLYDSFVAWLCMSTVRHVMLTGAVHELAATRCCCCFVGVVELELLLMRYGMYVVAISGGVVW